MKSLFLKKELKSNNYLSQRNVSYNFKATDNPLELQIYCREKTKGTQ